MKAATTILAALLACAGAASALPPLPKPPGPPGNPACLAHVNTLRSGACAPVAKKVNKDIAAKISGASCAELEAMDVTADASEACCADAVKFVQDGCGCDPGILGLIGAANIDAGVLSGAVRLAQTSHCAKAGPAGWVNPCSDTASCLAAAAPVKKAPTAKAG